MGQGNNVLIQYLFARNTADDHIWDLIQKKVEVLEKAGLKQDFTTEEIELNDENSDEERLAIDKFVEAEKENPTKPNFLEGLWENDDIFDCLDQESFI